MVKQWVNCVYNPCKEKIIQGFLDIIEKNREKHILYLLEDKKDSDDEAQNPCQNAFPILHYYQ